MVKLWFFYCFVVLSVLLPHSSFAQSSSFNTLVQAQRGDANSQLQLGLWYRDGVWVNKNYFLAVNWFELAAEQQNSAAQYQLSQMYLNGLGVSENPHLMLYWLRSAASLGFAKAQVRLAHLYQQGKRVERDDVQAFYWIQQAVKTGYSPALIELGRMYEQGVVVTANWQKALSLYQQANSRRGQAHATQLKQKINCRTSAVVELFSVRIKCANRATLATKIQANAAVKQEAHYANLDNYQLDSNLFGPAKLQVNYNTQQRFMNVIYQFTDQPASNNLYKIKHILTQAYGRADRTTSLYQYGSAQFYWYFDDGIEIRLSQSENFGLIQLHFINHNVEQTAPIQAARVLNVRW